MAQRDMASGAPMTKDAIFRDFSMTKPVTGVAMMILYEQGKWLPSDPIAKFIPEFAHLKVYKGVGADGKMILVDPDHPPTMRELMTHTAGFTYGFFGNTPVDKMYRDAHLFESKNLQEFIDKLAQIPLLYQPGKGWTYSVSMDIEGYIVEKLSGQSLPDFMRDHIFTPLGMRDAGFYVPADKRSRFATLYAHRTQRRTGRTTLRRRHAATTLRSPPCLRAAAAWSPPRRTTTASRRCWLNGGELDGKRILAPATVKLMTSNHLPANLLTGEYRHRRPGHAAGLWLRLQLRRSLRSARGQSARRQRHFLLGWRSGHMVLDRSRQRRRFCRHDPAHVGPASPPLEYREPRPWYMAPSSIPRSKSQPKLPCCFRALSQLSYCIPIGLRVYCSYGFAIGERQWAKKPMYGRERWR